MPRLADGPLPDGVWQTRRLADSDQFRRRLADGHLAARLDSIWQTRCLADSDQFRRRLADGVCRLADTARRRLADSDQFRRPSGSQTPCLADATRRCLADAARRCLADAASGRLRPIQTAYGRRRLADSDQFRRRMADGVCRLADTARRRLPARPARRPSARHLADSDQFRQRLPDAASGRRPFGRRGDWQTQTNSDGRLAD